MFNAKKTKNEIVRWIRTYFVENSNGGSAVIGISGGKDSSVVAALCVEALGKDKVVGVLMPQGEQYDINISFDLVNHLEIIHKVINIKDMATAFAANIEPLSVQALYNIPARIRMTVLYAISSTGNGRVANTSNLSEDWIGWATKFGDGAGDFSPLANLTATEVILIGKELGLPEKFVNKIPEDGLTGKSDEENFGFTYEVLDKYIREGICDDVAVKDKIDRLHKHNLHKTNSMPSYKY